jgi:hypothetical protein
MRVRRLKANRPSPGISHLPLEEERALIHALSHARKFGNSLRGAGAFDRASAYAMCDEGIV